MTAEEQPMSEREREILRLVATGATNPEIAAKLHISTNTVKVHLRNIYGKIGVVSRAEATLYAVRTGLITVERPLAESAPERTDAPDPLVEVALPTELGSTTGSLASEASAPRPTLVLSRGQLLGLIGLIAALLLAVIGLGLRSLPSTAAPNNGTNPLGTAFTAAALPSEAERWQALRAMPSANAGFALAQVSLEGRRFLFVIGGEGAEGLTQRYDPASDTWSTFSPKPTPVSAVQAAVVGNRIYLPGGRLSDGSITSAFEAYDPQLDRWQELAPLPAARSDYALAALEGKLYLFGGWSGRGYHGDVFRYLPDGDAWERLSPMAIPRGNAVATAIGDAILIFGGEDERGPLSLSQRYSPALEGFGNPWSVRAPLPNPRSRASIATIGDLAFLVGGTGSDMLIYNQSNDSWGAPITIPLPTGLRDLRTTALGDQLLIFGGRTFDGLSSATYRYQATYTLLLSPPVAP